VQPETKYARNGDVNIAYQVVGDGPRNLVLVPGFVSHLDLAWTEPSATRYLTQLASFARLIIFDKRGTGLSDPVAGVPTLEERMDDVRAVMDAAGSEQAAVYGISEGGPMAALFAATYPERTEALVMYGTIVRGHAEVGHPLGLKQESYTQLLAAIDHWGEGRSLEVFAPTLAGDALRRRVWGMYERAAASPAMARAVVDAWLELDLSEILPSIQVPTLVTHRTGDFIPVEGGRYAAATIPGATFVELEGVDHVPWFGDSDALVAEIEEFLTGARHAPEPERMLTTILFTDIVGSTERAAELGDARWRELLQAHDSAVRRELERHRGREIKTIGDGFLAGFDGPARAIRCAGAIRDAVRDLGMEVRAGVHTGECELLDGDLGGMAVHIGARVGACADPGEVLVSGTVKDLVVGSGIEFVDRGERELKGVPGEWRVFAVATDGEAAGAEEEPGPSADERVRGSDRIVLSVARRAPGLSRLAMRSLFRQRSRK
jgi:class 3 adenylate cyclase/pimeloyl-ACP methyl ester carboxylesterase